MATNKNTDPKHTTQLAKHWFNSLINSMADAVVAVDENLKISVYNAAALNIFDTNKSIEGLYLDSLVEIIDAKNKPVALKEYTKGLNVIKTNRDLKLLYPDKSTINLYFSISPIRQGYGKKHNQGFVILMRDITHEKSLEEERDEFISVISHELRTPIAIAEGEVSNALFLSEKENIKSQVTEALKEAHHQILFLSDMLNDLATLSRAERGMLKLEPEKINVVELVEELTAAYKPSAEEKGLSLSAHLDPHLVLLRSSGLYVKEVLQNFLTNSIKYTQKGSIMISAKPCPDGIEFEVSDTGIGISKGDQERVFDKFFRSEDFRTRESSGTGMGLYVTMKLAKLIKAEISLQSELNEGSTFRIKIPHIKS